MTREREMALPQRTRLLIGITSWAVAALVPLAASAQTARPRDDRSVRHYDPQGRLTGRSETRGDTTRFYDPQGRNAGRAERRSDGTTRFYETQGRAVRRSEVRK